MTLLTGKQRRFLRAMAHDKKPVVQVGHAGLTPAVTSAILQALETHELIKIKVSGDAELGAEALGKQVEEACNAHLAQVIGRTLLVYRRREQEPTIVLPRGEGRATREDV